MKTFKLLNYDIFDLLHLSVSQATEILPLAPLPPPGQLSERERLHLEEQEEDVLRELRLFLRSVTERLALDRRFKAFTKPVDVEEVSGICSGNLMSVLNADMDERKRRRNL